jgi:hypothetical protein
MDRNGENYIIRNLMICILTSLVFLGLLHQDDEMKNKKKCRYMNLIGKPYKKRQFGKERCRWDSIETDTEKWGMKQIQLARI